MFWNAVVDGSSMLQSRILDNLPAAMVRMRQDEGEPIKTYERGFPIGLKGAETVSVFLTKIQRPVVSRVPSRHRLIATFSPRGTSGSVHSDNLSELFFWWQHVSNMRPPFTPHSLLGKHYFCCSPLFPRFRRVALRTTTSTTTSGSASCSTRTPSLTSPESWVLRSSRSGAWPLQWLHEDLLDCYHAYGCEPIAKTA